VEVSRNGKVREVKPKSTEPRNVKMCISWQGEDLK